MFDNLSTNNKKALIKLKETFVFLKRECDRINQKIYFMKEILLSMITNLTYCNNIKIFQDTDANYLAILNELKEIKILLDDFKETITILNLKKLNIKIVNFKIITIQNTLIKFMNHIAPENFNYILQILSDENWTRFFNKTDFEKIIFISGFMKPLCIWDSENHKTEIVLKSPNKEMTPRSTMLTKDIIETLLGLKKPDNEKMGSIILSGESPSFLKNINDLIDIGIKKQNTRRNNIFNRLECLSILDNDNIKITKNPRSISLVEDKYGACIYLKLNSKFIVIQGLFKDDLLNFSNSNKYVKNIMEQHKKYFTYEVLMVPIHFKDSYFNIINLRDLVVCSSQELIEDVRKKYNDFKILQSKPLLSLINEFLLASKYRKIDILTLLLMSNEDDQKLAYVLFDVFKSKDKKDVSQEIYTSLHFSLRDLLDISKTKIEKEENDLSKFTDSDLPYERRINLMKVSDDVKSKAMEKLKSIKSSFQGDNKAQHWLDGLLKIPFNQYKDNEILSFKDNFLQRINQQNLFSDNDIDNYINQMKINDSSNTLIKEWEDYKVDKKNYLINIRKTLDDAVFGHKEAKLQLERLFAQWINGQAKGAVLGLKGPPGTGKTSIAKNGLSKCLKNKAGESRPFVFLPIGGSVNGSTLVGHNFTYVGSTWGRIADILMTTNCMNPIIFIDEIDKVSHTEHGREIISILTHLTDATQNDEFEDKYFAGIKLDLSKALIVFSFNDINLIDPILRDRITIIETNALSLNDKLTIIKDYMLPEICKEVGFNRNEIIISDDLIKHLIETYTNEAGIRKIKEKMVEIIRDINLNRFHSNDVQLPFTITEEYTKKLFENKPKVRITKIPSEPAVGIVNGLYASSGGGTGGITKIQVIKFPSDKMLDLNITGQAGDIMKESIQYALKNAYSLLSETKQEELLEASRNKKTFGIHVHCPDGATPKDGPSAGLAFTLAMYSLLTGYKVKNDICMTGEIDLFGKSGIIGGLNAKLNGAKKAGCTLALIPEENMEDLEIMRRENNSPEDDTFKVISVEHIKDVIKHAIV